MKLDTAANLCIIAVFFLLILASVATDIPIHESDTPHFSKAGRGA
jgi:hypothetical protein